MDISTLPENVLDDLLDYFLSNDAENPEEKVKELTKLEAFNTWLSYHGIIGYTDDILEAVSGIYGVDFSFSND